MSQKKDLIFECKECANQLYVDRDKTRMMLKTACPKCNRNPKRLWLLAGEGIFDDE